MHPDKPQIRRPALTGEDAPFDRKGRSTDYTAPREYEDTPTGKNPRNAKVEANRSARGAAHGKLVDSALAKGGGSELLKKVDKADNANKEEVESANMVAKGTTIADLERGAKMGLYSPVSGDAVNRARQGKKPQLRKEV